MGVFAIDYVLRLLTADFKMGQGRASFWRYPFTPMAIIDFISILPLISLLTNHYRILGLLKMLRLAPVLRIFKLLRYSKNIDIIINVFKEQRRPLLFVCSFVLAYIMAAALLVFNVEPQTFETYFDAVYWATISLTTVGYGDIYPVTTIGRLIAMTSSIFGIAIIALPSGIITAGYMEQISHDKKRD